MPSALELPPALRALVETGWALAARAPSARVALARAAGLLDAAALPEPIRDAVTAELETAREAACTPLDRRTVERALRDAWGRPVGQVLDDLDPEPLAVRAAAQTHRGVTDGTEVAVRVRRPGLERAVRNDLALLDALAPVLGAALPRADARGLLRAVREQVLDELDFEHEASLHRRVARVVRGIDGVTVPRAHAELCTEGVFVADVLDGRTLADGARPGDPGAAARALVAVHVAAARDAGLALLDPRPGHVLALADGGIGLLGTGLAQPVDRARVEHVLTALHALRDDDDDAFEQAIAASGILPADAAATAFDSARTVLGPMVSGPARLDADALRETAIRAADVAADAFALTADVQPRPDDLWLGRLAAQLVPTLAVLEATEDWPALTR
jgi:predicted unusual protein kinase regulating ubiquinone biosynthesis (AarF/ABC1/UbiB family)